MDTENGNGNENETELESQNPEEESKDTNSSLYQALEDVDKFLTVISGDADKSDPPEIPTSCEMLLDSLGEMMDRYDSLAKQEDIEFNACLSRISKLITAFKELANPAPDVLNRARTVLQQATSFLDGEFRAILGSCEGNKSQDRPKSPKRTFSVLQRDKHVSDPSPEATPWKEFPGYSDEAILNMKRVATAMIESGNESECSIVYNMTRKNAFNRELDELGFNDLGMEEVSKMAWIDLQHKISSWVIVTKEPFSKLLSSERNLCDTVFSDYRSISQKLFSGLAMSVTVRLLNFVEAICVTERSPEKLFKFLDVYEALPGLIPSDNTYSSECGKELESGTWNAQTRIGEAVMETFRELENSIHKDGGNPVPSGAVHPLTRYTMNYLGYTGAYEKSLEQIFQLHQKADKSSDPNDLKQSESEPCEGANEDGTSKTSPFSVQLQRIMDLLDENLNAKSSLYKNPALRHIFLMNNSRYILQKIKTFEAIHNILGMNWSRMRSSNVRQYHKSYTRETWTKLLQSLIHEGLQVNGKISKPLVKERFKSFNSMFDEIHKTQSAWLVSDEQLQSELRVSICAVVIPAYRSFVGRFQQCLHSGRQTQKYIKYQPEDIEDLIDDLFAGNPTSMSKKR